MNSNIIYELRLLSNIRQNTLKKKKRKIKHINKDSIYYIYSRNKRNNTTQKEVFKLELETLNKNIRYCIKNNYKNKAVDLK